MLGLARTDRAFKMPYAFTDELAVRIEELDHDANVTPGIVSFVLDFTDKD
jgi:hypothetical protein